MSIDQLGRVRTDNYAWLHQPNWFTSLTNPSSLDPAIHRHLGGVENAYCDAVLKRRPWRCRRNWRGDCRAQRRTPAALRPVRTGLWLYWSAVRPGANHPTFSCVAPAPVARTKPWPTSTPLGRRPRLLPHLWHHPATAQRRPSPVRLGGRRGGRSAFPPLCEGPGHRRHRAADRALFRRLRLLAGLSAWIFWVYRNAQSRPTKIFPPARSRRRGRAGL